MTSSSLDIRYMSHGKDRHCFPATVALRTLLLIVIVICSSLLGQHTSTTSTTLLNAREAFVESASIVTHSKVGLPFGRRDELQLNGHDICDIAYDGAGWYRPGQPPRRLRKREADWYKTLKQGGEFLERYVSL